MSGSTQNALVVGTAAVLCGLAWFLRASGMMGLTQSNNSRQQGGHQDTVPAAAAGSGGSAEAAAPPEKLGAGLLLTCDGEVLLLRRTSKHNHGTWGLPGGNADATDTDLLHTATREAHEEVGSNLPPFQVVTEVLTRRGKRQQKHFKVYVARITPEQKATWQPELNEEHSDWRWFKLTDAQLRRDLHPVVSLALQSDPYRHAVVAAVLSRP